MTMTAMEMCHTISFGFRATGKYTICLYGYVGMGLHSPRQFKLRE